MTNKKRGIDMKENKSKAPMILIILLIVAAIGLGCWYVATPENNTSTSSGTVTTKEPEKEMVPSDEYIYTQEQKDAMYDAAEKKLQLAIMNTGIEPFMSYRYEQSDYGLTNAVHHMALAKTEAFYGYYPQFDEGLVVYWPGYGKDDVFNVDMSLKSPSVFTGFVGTDIRFPTYEQVVTLGQENLIFNPSLTREQLVENAKTLATRHSDAIQWRESEMAEERYRQFVQAVLDLDNYLKGTTTAEGTKKYFSASTDTISRSTGPALSSYVREFTKEQGSKNTSTNPMLTFFKYAIDGYAFETDIHNASQILAGYNYELNYDVEYLPSEFNYFEINEEGTWAHYIPTKVTNDENDNILVELEVDNPLNTESYIDIINMLYAEFAVQNSQEAEKNNVDCNISVVVRYKDDHGMTSPFSVVNIENFDNYSQSGLYRIVEWYPGGEAREWMRTYFDKCYEAYENDSYFSIVDTVEEVANEYGVDKNDVLSVVMSYYYVTCMQHILVEW